MTQSILPDFDQEMATTRRVVERVPADQGEWKPHPKSFALGHLAQGPGYTFESTQKLLSRFDEDVRAAREALAATRPESLAEPWSLMMGDRVLFTSPRGEVVRSTLNHLVHHRGQLTVYLRLLDVPVPSIYGPTADEPW